jgi:hypothetical protein
MKRVVTILLLCLFLFNVGGYNLVFWALRKHANVELTARLDNNAFETDETIELKIPITLPYASNPTGFERTRGKFEYGGNFYQLVKQKLEKDTLYVVCIPDHQEKQLVKTMHAYAELANELPAGAKKALTFIGKILKEFNPSFEPVHVENTTGWARNLTFIPVELSLFQKHTSETYSPPKV